VRRRTRFGSLGQFIRQRELEQRSKLLLRRPQGFQDFPGKPHASYQEGKLRQDTAKFIPIVLYPSAEFSHDRTLAGDA
jgi:hypothetical protein